MARAIWSGSISFGLVSVPVRVFAAVRDRSVHFNQLEKGTGARIQYKEVSDKTGKEVSGDKIQSGYELSSGKYVVVENEELDKLRPRTTRTIEVKDFVTLDDIDPIYYERTCGRGGGPVGGQGARPDGRPRGQPGRRAKGGRRQEAIVTTGQARQVGP